MIGLLKPCGKCVKDIDCRCKICDDSIEKAKMMIENGYEFSYEDYLNAKAYYRGEICDLMKEKIGDEGIDMLYMKWYENGGMVYSDDE